MKKADQYVKVKGFQKVSLIGLLNFKEIFKNRIILWPFFVFTKGDFINSFYKNNCTGSAVYNDFTALPLHFNFTYLHCSVCSFNDQEKVFFHQKGIFFIKTHPADEELSSFWGCPACQHES